MHGGGWGGKTVHGKDIFREVKELRVGRLQRRERGNKRGEIVELID